VLSAEQRLRRKDEFAAAIRSGRRAGRGVVVVHLRASGPSTGEVAERAVAGGASRESNSPRAGFVVPRAVGNAVVRNKVRRRLRHLVRGRLASLPPGSLLVVRAQPGAGDRPYRRLAADLDAALKAVRSMVVAR
jgi:ribonuclease P protein component